MSLSDRELEAAAVGSVLLRPALWPEVAAAMSSEDLTDPELRSIFVAIGCLVGEDVPLDPVIVANEAGVEAIVVRDLEAAVGVPGVHHAQRVAKLSASRRLIVEAESIIHRAVQGTDPGAIVGEVVPRLQEVGSVGLGELLNPRDLAEQAYIEAERPLRGVGTGLGRLDHGSTGNGGLGGGLRPGNLYVVGARPSVGKSALVTNFARAALDEGITVLFVSLEMSGVEVLTRLVADAFNADPGDLPAIIRHMAHDRVQTWPLRFLARADLAGVVASTRRVLPGLAIVDYLQLLPIAGRFERRDLELGFASRTLKQLAQKVNVPIVACSQINRDPVKAGRAPRLSDLRESGNIEADADVVMILHRDAEEDQRETKLILAKNRQGPTGTVELYFDAVHTRFRSLFGERP